MPRRPLTVLTGALLLGLSGGGRDVSCQDPPPPETPVVADDNVARIRAALASEPPAGLRAPRFYVEVVARQQSIAEYFKGTDWRYGILDPMPPLETIGGGRGSGGVGFDPMQIVYWVRARVRDYQIRKIRARIDRELRALAGEED